jgi:hypothetical protein
MTINNPALYDSAFVAIANSNMAWLTDTNPTDYAGQKNAASAIAAAIDALIPTIDPGPTLSQLLLMESIVEKTFITRFPLVGTDFSAIAESIAAQFNEFTTGLQDPYVPIPPASPFIYYLDSSPDPIIPNYLQLTPEGSFTPSTQVTATATGTPTTTTQFVYSGNPVSWIAQQDFGVPFIQQGEWTNDFYASVNQPVSTTNLKVSFYSRTTGGVETHLFDVLSPRVTLSTPSEVSGEATEITYSVNLTDRLVVKVFGQFTGTTVSTTATLYFQGTTAASHIHSPIQS